MGELSEGTTILSEGIRNAKILNIRMRFSSEGIRILLEGINPTEAIECMA